MNTAATSPGKKQFNVKTITFEELTWVDIVQPTRESTNYLAERYNFHPLDLDDCLSHRQISKLETYPDYLFVIFHLSVYDKATRKSTRMQWSAFVGDTYLITLRPGELKSLDALYRQCELSDESRQEYLGQGSGYLLYRILDRAVDSYFPVLSAITSQMEDIEDDVFSEQAEAGKEISILRRDIITQRRVMFPTRTLFIDLEKRLGRFSRTSLTIYFSDLMDHMNRICETLDEFSEIIEVYKDADYILSGYRANRVIRLVAVLFTIGLPFIVAIGVYDLSVLTRGAEAWNIKLFLSLLAVILIFIGGMLYYFRRKRLI